MNHQPQLIRLSDGISFDLESETTIGRRDDCSIVLEEAGISRFHAQITIAGNDVTIEDFSRNGTDVNGKAITTVTQLGHQDTIRFDREEYQLDFPDASGSAENALPEEPAMTEVVFADAAPTEIAVDAIRKPLPPANPHTQVVLPQSNQSYEPLDHRNFSGPSLVVRNGKNAGKIFSLPDSESRWTIGSSGESNLVIDDEGVSSRHAVVQRSNNSWEVTDQMATNVLRVNGNITNKCFLANGDKITLGAIDCEFVLPSGYKVRDGGSTSAGKSRFATYFFIALILLIAVAAGIYFGQDFI